MRREGAISSEDLVVIGVELIDVKGLPGLRVVLAAGAADRFDQVFPIFGLVGVTFNRPAVIVKDKIGEALQVNSFCDDVVVVVERRLTRDYTVARVHEVCRRGLTSWLLCLFLLLLRL